MSTIAEQQLPYDKALAELKKEIAMNGRLESLLSLLHIMKNWPCIVALPKW